MEGNPFTEVVDHSFCEQTYPDPPIQPAGTCKRKEMGLHFDSSHSTSEQLEVQVVDLLCLIYWFVLFNVKL